MTTTDQPTTDQPTGDQPTSGQPTGARMPALFIGHGSPMNTLERNRYTDGWRTAYTDDATASGTAAIKTSQTRRLSART